MTLDSSARLAARRGDGRSQVAITAGITALKPINIKLYRYNYLLALTATKPLKVYVFQGLTLLELTFSSKDSNRFFVLVLLHTHKA